MKYPQYHLQDVNPYSVDKDQGTGGDKTTSARPGAGICYSYKTGKTAVSTSVLVLNSLFLACTLLLTACGDPEKSAQSAIDEAQKSWEAEASDLDPLKRLKSYNEIIKAVEDVGKDYAETSYGKAIAAGRATLVTRSRRVVHR